MKTNHRRVIPLLSLLVSTLCAGSALAGEPEKKKPKRPPGASSKHEIEQEGEPIEDDDEDIETATPDPTPAPVKPGDDMDEEPEPDVIEQAGVGGPVPFGAAAVLEVGGGGLVQIDGEYGLVRLRPFLRWFFYDGVALSFYNDLYVVHGLSEKLRVAFTATVEPSAHFPLDKRLWFAIGLGGGAIYNGSEFGGVIEPRVGFDILIGRSGLLHISIVGTFSTADLVGAGAEIYPETKKRGALEIAYGIMF